MFSNTDSIAAQCPNVGVLQHSVPTWVYCSTVSPRGCIAAQCPNVGVLQHSVPTWVYCSTVSQRGCIAAQCPHVGVLQHSVPTWVYCSTVSQRGCIAAQCPHALREYFITIVSNSHKPHLRSNKVQASPGFTIAYLNIFCTPTMIFYVLADCISFRDRSYTMPVESQLPRGGTAHPAD